MAYNNQKSWSVFWDVTKEWVNRRVNFALVDLKTKKENVYMNIYLHPLV